MRKDLLIQTLTLRLGVESSNTFAAGASQGVAANHG